MSKEQKTILVRIIISSILTVAAAVWFKGTELPIYVKLPVILVPYLIVGYDIVWEALEGVFHGELLDEDFLMAVATIGALALGEYAEGVAVLIFFRIGELFENYAVDKSRDNITELMDIRPDYANLENGSDVTKVAPDQVAIGSVTVVYPGEKIPIDGVVVEGNSSLHTAALTGESVPREVQVGDAVVSGCVNLSSPIKVRTTKEFGESTVSKILKLVEDAGEKKSKSENFISKFARVYTPIVCACALALAVIPPLFLKFAMHTDANFTQWLYRGLTFLVISCPCALVISIPLSFFAGIGGASKAGVLIKGSNYLEALSKMKYVLFDKTGTVTEGVFQVTDVHHNQTEQAELLELVAHIEAHSTHPIAKSIVQAYGKPVDDSRVTELEEISGHGVCARVDGRAVAAGNARLMERLGIAYEPCHEQGTIVHVAIDGQYDGHILISDVVKPTAKPAIAALKAQGVKKAIMLTGDTKAVAEAVTKELEADAYYSDLLPDEKVSKVEEVLNEKKPEEILAFVGDGINDAPVLMRADVGIAMGALGSDAAIEAADVVLMDDNPEKIAKAMSISRKCMRIVYENIVFAIGVKMIFLLLSAVGIANMWLAIFADVGVMIIAVCNAIRALRVK